MQRQFFETDTRKISLTASESETDSTISEVTESETGANIGLTTEAVPTEAPESEYIALFF